MANVYKLCVSASRHATDTFVSCAIYLPVVCCCPIGVVDHVRVDRDVHVDEAVVQRLPRSDIGAIIWHVPIVPVVDVLKFALRLEVILVPGINWSIDPAGPQIGVHAYFINLSTRHSVQLVVWVGLHDGEQGDR
jgi:hypothetical protein